MKRKVVHNVSKAWAALSFRLNSPPPIPILQGASWVNRRISCRIQ